MNQKQLEWFEYYFRKDFNSEFFSQACPEKEILEWFEKQGRLKITNTSGVFRIQWLHPMPYRIDLKSVRIGVSVNQTVVVDGRGNTVIQSGGRNSSVQIGGSGKSVVQINGETWIDGVKQ